ncbi:alanyl-tRNA synthetase [Cnuella takakiae]|uniref:Alanine--tRNA ligase n=1 Tax=Cnuella takakiae TaxID=1302690 RepID=A0A1M5EUW2_9BACT|nr:alanine--tRNA ligase [Cnuella takakiae]OLY91310.1 alanine--tRNA ligase [Cnuella takakiae]SHF83028.1 alanyl-tRNA synthetase [Cnuella takakiae]
MASTEINSTQPQTAAQIRAAFLDFFRSKEHQIVPSAPIVVKNDPTLMFTNAGMNQFKDYFLGNKPAPSPRIADTQKCLRVSGKHNDLEEVGVDHYHHTMFEMLGNWSFGNYFKKEAIAWSWELLTKYLQIPIDRLYVTIFEGDEREGIPKDTEAYEEWSKWIAPERILLGNKKDNFWEMGDTGPCGPCTEIHVDTRSEAERAKGDGASLVNNDHPEVIEIWNNVFIQFNRLKDGSLQPLPARHVDTGMGFERLVRVLQNKQSNYDTDVFSGTIDAISKITGVAYGGTQSKADIGIRVNADHIRAIAFTIADGQLPASTGAGYVIRRILRRAVRYYYSYLNYQQPLLHQLVPVLAGQFADVFPELKQQEAFVARVVREEEEAFLRTLEKGLKRIEDIIGASKDLIGGKETFELYDTYGFPVDLTRLIASERGLTVDEAGFEAEMQQQKDRSRAASATDAGDWVVLKEGGLPEFVGYTMLESTAEVLRYRKVKAKGKEGFQLVLDRTPFYAESGGQVGDTGVLATAGGELKVLDTKKENDLIVHFVDRIPEGFAGGEVMAHVDKPKRKATELHHSATHLLHAALRKVLGTHVAQKGSLVNSEYLRFDFSHFSKMTDEEIRQVETIVNEKIRQNIPVIIRQMPKEEAVAQGAMALFGEKYGDTVRVVTIDPEYSVELCGGTHVGATGELGLFKITSEAAVAAGVRRVEALCGAAAEAFVNDQMLQFAGVREALNNPKDVLKSIAQLKDEAAALRKKIEGFENAQLITLRDELKGKTEAIGDAQFIGAVVSVGSADALKKLAFELKAQVPNYLIALAANVEGKAQVVLLFDDALTAAKGLDASKMIKQNIAPLIKGGGGGQKTLATAGGQNATQLEEVIKAVKENLFA